RSGSSIPSAESGFHFAAHFDRGIVGSVGDIAPAKLLARSDVALQSDIMRKPERQQAALERALRRGLLAPDAKAALAVEHFASLEVALGGRHHIGAEAGGRAGRLTAQRSGRHRNPKLEADHVDRPIQRRVFAARIGQHRVFLEAAPRIIALALEHDISAERKMVWHVAAVAIDRGGDLGDPGLFQHAAVRLRLADFGELETRRRREAQALALRHEPRGVAHRAHLDARLGAIDEAVEHLRIDRGAILYLKVLIEDVPQRVGRRLMISRVITRALAGGDHFEAAGARPVDMLADQRRLVAPGEAVDDTGAGGAAREQRTGDDIGLHIDHDDVLAVLDGLERVADAGRGNAGGLDDDVDLWRADQRIGIVRDERGTARERVIERGGGISVGIPAGGFELILRARDVEIDHADEMHAARQAHLREEHGAEFSGTDEHDANGPSGGLALEQFGMQIHAPFLRDGKAEHSRVVETRRIAKSGYWQSARETNVSLGHSPGVPVRPESRTRAGHFSAVVMSRLLPSANPLALQIALAAATQSGAPLGATVQRS